jgi:predicted nuclease of predicted toxin-antitoxin system
LKFVVDNQLPAALAGWLRSRGEDAVHVLEREQARADDRLIWREASAEQRIVVSKDEDFVLLASRPGDSGRLLWLRLGNCRTADLIARLDASWEAIAQAFIEGQRIVELR